MKILGIAFLVIGIPLCFTLIFTPFGFGFCVVGVLLIIASAIVRRQKAQEELAREMREQRAGVANSQFGR